MLHLDVHLTVLGLHQYHEVLVDHGFEAWQSPLSVTEEDMARCHIKRGHRRKLQRAVAKFQGTPDWKPLFSSSPVGKVDFDAQGPRSPTISHLSPSVRHTMISKRRYPRHPPKKDYHAPPRAQSGYVLFASFLRQNPQVSDLPFISFAELVGYQRYCLSTHERKTWVSRAAEQ